MTEMRARASIKPFLSPILCGTSETDGEASVFVWYSACVALGVRLVLVIRVVLGEDSE